MKSITLPIKNYLTDEIFTLESIDNLAKISDTDYGDIVRVNNEELIYNTLHREKFQHQPYTLETAKGWIHKQVERWHNQSKYNFLIRNNHNIFVGAIDITPLSTDTIEVGYYVSTTAPGIMTNTVLAICDLAKDYGYRLITAKTKPDNIQSQNVLRRTGFQEVQHVNGDVIFQKKL